MLEQGLRFLLVGGANTALGYAIYCLLVFWMHPQWAWAVCYAIGIGLGYAAHSRLVFRASLSRGRAAAYTAMQVSMYLLGSLVIASAMRWPDIGPRLAALLALCVTVPISFLVSRRILREA